MTSVFVPGSPSQPTARRAAGYVSPFSPDDYAAVARFFSARPDLKPAPLRPLPALARALGLGALLVKDETARFGLNAFKLLGARFAVEHLMDQGRIRAGDTLVCASEGNHGRAVAHTARIVGCDARVYLSNAVAQARADAIQSEGATVVRVDGTYDDAVRQAAADAEARGWTVISDTSWVGYEEVPRLIMLGYTHMVDEVSEAMGPDSKPDAIFVPGGVGGLLAGIACRSAALWSAGASAPATSHRPSIVAVEPSSAQCLQVSARAGRPTTLPGPFPTMMGGLRCGEVSPLAFRAAAPLVDGYLAIDDDWAANAMRMLARPTDSDPAIHAGPSGAAALGGLLATLQDPAAAPLARALGLGPDATVLLIVSEGVTDPELWRDVVGPA